MNMKTALRNLYKAITGEDNTKNNYSKLLVDIHYAITGKESENKNNWSKIINSMADNWPEGGGGTTIEALSVTENGTYTATTGKAYSPVTVNVSGGSSDFSTAEVTLNLTPPQGNTFNKELVYAAIGYPSTVYDFNGDGYYFTNTPLRATNHKVSVLLYNGVGYIDSVEGHTSEEDTFWAVLSSATVSGDIAWDANLSQTGAFVVSGNGTITVSEWGD